MPTSNYIKILTLFTAMAANNAGAGEDQQPHSDEFCKQVSMHGERSWQALSSYDANEHDGVNLYLMNEQQRKDAISRMIVGLSTTMKENIVNTRIRLYSVFDQKSDIDKSVHIVKELSRHGISVTTVDRAAQNCQP
ncbi:MAG: hypothetical protein KTR28_07855 [Micavibrio sp.]|nr:hypothetical protein [Micavibrio sp.]